MSKIIDKILNEVSLDERVKDGMFNIENDTHMEVMREYLVKKGIANEHVIDFSNKILEGKFPHRQAFNSRGILVTFPDAEYKAAAIKRGTHFEENPKKKLANVFVPDDNNVPKTNNNNNSTTEPKTNLPVSQASATSPTETPSANDNKSPNNNNEPTTAIVQPKTTAAPQQTPTGSPEAELTVKEPSKIKPVIVKSPQEKEADKNMIKNMLKGDDYMLEEVAKFIMYNGPNYILEEINKKFLSSSL